MYKITTIVPIYNVELYIEECIQSIINQTFGFENIQLILIDDNSTDESYNIAKRYKDEYPENIIVKQVKKNSGNGGTPRNIGINLAEGKYLTFADADDFFDKTAFKRMYDEIEKTNADFITTNWRFTDIQGNIWEKPVYDFNRFHDFKLDINDCKETVHVMNSSMCNKIFNREFINRYNIRCLENLPGEDTYFSMKAFLNSKNVYYINDVTYYYRQRNTMYKTVSSSWDCSKKFFIGMSKAYQEVYQEFVNHNQIKFYRYIYAKNMNYLLYRFIDSSSLNNKDKLEVLKELKWFFKLSKTLDVPLIPKSLNVLLDKIIENKFEDAIAIANIVFEMRSFMDENVKYKMSKPYNQNNNYCI